MKYVDTCLLPPKIKSEICDISSSYVDFFTRLNEIRLRSFGPCTVTIDGENMRLASSVNGEELRDALSRLCRGSLYAYTDSIRQGYISLPLGIRVGISGRARYSDMRLVGISTVDTLVYRFPLRHLINTDKVYSFFEKGGGGMLIFSVPMGGKTTLLASLGANIGRTKRLVIVDERGEFVKENYSDKMVDILSGYSKRDGIEIAMRTHSCEVIMVDELSFDDTVALRPHLGGGVPLIASVHASTLSEAKNKAGIKEMIKEGIFQTFVGIKRQNGAFIYDLYEDKV